ncbi:TRAM domain-containing protein [Snodgrassella sp. CFCC 13594]|uniref:TRAM domain-containing protein n=1 Tax=Snodgrassella sp. CFCC 13594 TaxID=1775559 RepID=UPI000A71CADE|nr:TRAM domain-containing protein [Snodgrassella sp. CFCC 13594]
MPNQFVMSEQSVLKGPLWITDIDHDGRGIGRTDGKVVFVADALPGETVWWQSIREKKNLIEGRARQWRDYSDVRRSPPCAYAVRCGGCQWQHIDDAAQVAFKQRVFEAQLRRIGQVWPTQILAPIYGLLGIIVNVCAFPYAMLLLQ